MWRVGVQVGGSASAVDREGLGHHITVALRMPVRRGDKWRSFAELNGVVLADWQLQKIYVQVTALGPLAKAFTFDLDYAR